MYPLIYFKFALICDFLCSVIYKTSLNCFHFMDWSNLNLCSQPWSLKMTPEWTELTTEAAVRSNSGEKESVSSFGPAIEYPDASPSSSSRVLAYSFLESLEDEELEESRALWAFAPLTRTFPGLLLWGPCPTWAVSISSITVFTSTPPEDLTHARAPCNGSQGWRREFLPSFVFELWNWGCF